MKYVLVSDGHLTSKQPPGRLDNALDTCVRKFRWLLQFCDDNGANLLQAGDLFDNDRDWYILAEVAEALYDYVGRVRVYTVPGQHDKYYRTKQKATNLGVLEKAGLVTVLGSAPTYTTEIAPLPPGADLSGDFDIQTEMIIVALYGFGWGDEWRGPVRKPKAHYHLMVTHAPVAPNGVYPGHEVTKPVLAAMLGYHVVLCGDVHRQFHVIRKGCDIINTGPVYRHRAEEYSFTHKPSVALWQDGAINWHEIPHEAADVVISREHLTTHAENKASLLNFTAKLRNRPTGEKATLRERVLAKLKQGRYHASTIKLLKEVMGNVK